MRPESGDDVAAKARALRARGGDTNRSCFRSAACSMKRSASETRSRFLDVPRTWKRISLEEIISLFVPPGFIRGDAKRDDAVTVFNGTHRMLLLYMADDWDSARRVCGGHSRLHRWRASATYLFVITPHAAP